MLCERCHNNPATAILTQTVNGRTITEHLCAECAYLNGFTGLFNGFPFSEVLQSMSRASGGKRCEGCGASLDEIVESGRIGCAECYKTFRAELAPTIQNIHGKAIHVGKRPHRLRREIPEKVRLEQLKSDMQTAVSNENFEMAAKLRDEIRKLQQHTEDSGDTSGINPADGE